MEVSVQKMGRENFVTTAVGRAFQVFDANRMQMLFASQDAGGDVTCVAARGERTMCGRPDGRIAVFIRDKRVGTIEATSGARVVKMKFVDDAHVLAAHEDGTLALWEVGKRRRTARFVVPKQPVSVMQCADAWPDGAACRVVDLCLLPAHVNKVLVACAPSEGDAGNAGALQLFNYRTSKRPSASTEPESFSRPAPITDCNKGERDQ